MLAIYPENKTINDVCHENTIVILEFGGSYCSACTAINNKLQNFVLENHQVNGYYIPIEMYPELAASVSIFTAPAVLVYVQGSLTIRETGCFSLEDIYRRVERYLKLLEE